MQQNQRRKGICMPGCEACFFTTCLFRFKAKELPTQYKVTGFVKLFIGFLFGV